MNHIEAVIAFLPILYVSGFVHEFGHAAMGKLNGFIVSSFGMGLARPVAVWNWGETRVFLCLAHPFQGLTTLIYPSPFPPVRKHVPALAGGVVANGILALIGFILWAVMPWGSGVWILTGWLNALLVIVNLVPFELGGHVALGSDGMQILQAFRGRVFSPPAPLRIRSSRTLTRLAMEIDDNAGRYFWHLQAALSWLELGVLSEAEVQYAEMSAIPAEKTAVLQALDALLRATIAYCDGRFEDSAEALKEFETQFHGLDGEMGGALSGLTRVELLLHQGDAEAASTLLEELATHPGIRKWPILQAELPVLRMVAHATLPSAEGIEDLRSACEIELRRDPSFSKDLRVYHTLGQYYTKRQEWNSAAAAYEKALTAVRQIHSLFGDESDQEVFLRAHGALIAEAKECLGQVGGVSESERVDRLFVSSAALAHERHMAARARSRRFHRWGLIITLFNLLCVALAVALALALRGRTPPGIPTELGLLFFAFVAGVFVYTISVAVFQICIFLIGLMRPSARGFGGHVALVLSIAPWPTSLVVLIISWIA